MAQSNGSRKAIIAQRIRAKKYVRNLQIEISGGFKDYPHATAMEQRNAAMNELGRTLAFLERTE